LSKIAPKLRFLEGVFLAEARLDKELNQEVDLVSRVEGWGDLVRRLAAWGDDDSFR
jgi:hypothetical protein